MSKGQRPLFTALSHCVEKHPLLGAVIVDGSSEKPGFAVLETLDLSKHIGVRDFGDHTSENQRIEELLAEVSDEQFSSEDIIPPWKVVIMALPNEGASTARLLVLFAYYHSHGDGKSGLAFHQTFFEGLQDAATSHQMSNNSDLSTCKTSSAELPTPMEQAGKLTLSWSYLLSPLLGAYLPNFLANMLGVRASAVAQTGGIWNGKDLSFDPNNFQTGLAMITIDYRTMHAALQCCRARQTSFTGLLNHLIARSISATLGPDHSTKAFASQIVIDLRRLCHGAHGDAIMTNCVSAYNETIPAPSKSTDQSDWTNPANSIWAAARNTTAELANAASTLHNQPIGLLQYLSDFRGWTLGQIGKKRECSFEISNLVVFDPVSPARQSAGSPAPRVQIEKTIFSQPANAAGAALNFNLVSTKNGPLVMTVTWQRGVLNVGDMAQEGEFVRKVCERVEEDIGDLAAVPLS